MAQTRTRLGLGDLDRRNVLQRLAESLWASEQREQATSVLLYLVRLAPDDPDALYKAALAFNLQGQHQRAVEFCQRVLAILGLPADPSRYLYLASAGSSLLITAALDRVRCTVHAYAFTISLLLILASSYFSLNQVKAISLYTSGRFYLARGTYLPARPNCDVR